MDAANTLRDYGLFDAKVPRYTSYPPANRFQADIGAVHQEAWLRGLAPDAPVSIYIHIPFCRRLCWFCACRTQGTSTLSPVENYVADLVREIERVAAIVPDGLAMGRLHLGGGTPTLLSPALLQRVLEAVHRAFPPARSFEFSVEIDPTEAVPGVLDALAGWGMMRASIGVQDFNERVQQAIGREQSFVQTRDVIDHLRANGVHSLNIDLLYGLPHQTRNTLMKTLDQIVLLNPDRLALYGYAHVPHVSKRQAMIPFEALPGVETRFDMATLASKRLQSLGYEALGIDHFARATDSLAKAAQSGKMRRNFQGYTDDPCDTLIGFGASAISRFPSGYLQNAVGTADYRKRVQNSGLAAQKGYQLSLSDRLVDRLIEAIMCGGAIEPRHYEGFNSEDLARVLDMMLDLARNYPKAIAFDGATLRLRPGMMAFARLLASKLDTGITKKHTHSIAI